MSRSSQLQTGHYYHLYSDWSDGVDLFSAESDYLAFLHDYSQALGNHATTFAYCLLPTHVHLFVRTFTLQEQIERWYEDHSPSQPFQPAHFEMTMQSIIGSERPWPTLHCVAVRHPDSYAHLVRYIHQNPVIHQMADTFQTWRWSSYQAILGDHKTQIAVAQVRRWFHGVEWFEELHWEPVDQAKIGYLILND